MKRSQCNTQWFIVMVISIFLFAGSLSIYASGGYSNKDLLGTYHYVSTTVQQVRGNTVVDGKIEFCSESGTITFDGRGTARVNGTQRCNADVEIEKNLNHYSVYPDGSFEIWNVDYPETVTHCQIANGDTILCDGTIPNPEILSTLVIGVKQKKWQIEQRGCSRC